MEKKIITTKKVIKKVVKKRVTKPVVTETNKDILNKLVETPIITKDIEEVIIPEVSAITPIIEEIVLTDEEKMLQAVKTAKAKTVKEVLPTESSDPHLIPSIVATLVFLLITLLIWYFYKGDKKPIITYTANDTTQQIKIADATTTQPVKDIVENITLSDPSSAVGGKKVNITTSESKNVQGSNGFNSFTYDSSIGKQIVLSGICHDIYYSLLIFNEKDDYRKNPSAAVSNKAFICKADKKFTVDINLRDLNLASGTYYVFVADQGKTGSWYNAH